MPNTGIKEILYSRGKDPLEFRYDNIPPAPPIANLLTQYDIKILNDTARSLRYAGNMQKKYDIIDKVLTNRGFKRFASGTNRVVYTYLESYDFIIKVALDRVGLSDSPREFQNQVLLQPFVTKVFEVTPCGTVGTFERVKPIIRKEEFISIAGDVFDLINKKIIGKYILDDIGSDYFNNWGLRTGFGPVVLDFPYVFELDGDKLACTRSIPELDNERCTGLIDYDIGFNNLVCNQCGRQYNALDLEKKDSGVEIIKGGSVDMKVILRKGNEVIEKRTGVDHIQRTGKAKEVEKTSSGMEVLFRGGKRDLETTPREEVNGIESHEDLMKARREIMEKQNAAKRETTKEKQLKEHQIDESEEVQRVLSDHIKESDNEKTNEEIYEEYIAKEKEDISEDEEYELSEEEIDSIKSIDPQDGLIEEEMDEDSISEQMGVTHEDLTDIDRIEDKYSHLEEEFEEETYEKIINDTKKFY